MKERNYHGSFGADSQTLKTLHRFSFVENLGEEKNAVFREEFYGAGSEADQYRRPIGGATQTRSDN